MSNTNEKEKTGFEVDPPYNVMNMDPASKIF